MSRGYIPLVFVFDFHSKYCSSVIRSYYNDNKIVYSKNKHIYDISFLTLEKIKKLMEQSLKEGEDLVFEACKDKEIIVTQEMRKKAEAAGVLSP